MNKLVLLAAGAWCAVKLVLLSTVSFQWVIQGGVMANLLILIVLGSVAGMKAHPDLGFVTRLKSVLQPVMMYAVLAAGLSGLFYYQVATEQTAFQQLEREQAIITQFGDPANFEAWQAEDPATREYLDLEETKQKALDQAQTMFSPWIQVSLHLTGLLFAGLLTALFTTILTAWLRL
jgi:hypothetical protein